MQISPDASLEEIRALSSSDRMTMIHRLKQRVLQGEKLPESEVRLAHRLLRAERGARSLEAAKPKRSAGAKKAPQQEFDLGAIISGSGPAVKSSQ